MWTGYYSWADTLACTVDEVFKNLNVNGQCFQNLGSLLWSSPERVRRESRLLHVMCCVQGPALVWEWPRPLRLVWVTNLWFCDRYEALNVIYSRGAQPSARFERWKLRLQPWIYELGKLCRISSQQCRRPFMFDKDSCFRETSLWDSIA